MNVELTDQEIREMIQVLSQEARSGHNELRRTRNPEFRDSIRRHVDLLESAMTKLQQRAA